MVYPITQPSVFEPKPVFLNYPDLMKLIGDYEGLWGLQWNFIDQKKCFLVDCSMMSNMFFFLVIHSFRWLPVWPYDQSKIFTILLLLVRIF